MSSTPVLDKRVANDGSLVVASPALSPAVHGLGCTSGSSSRDGGPVTGRGRYSDASVGFRPFVWRWGRSLVSVLRDQDEALDGRS